MRVYVRFFINRVHILLTEWCRLYSVTKTHMHADAGTFLCFMRIDNIACNILPCTSNFLSAAAPCSDKQTAHVPLNVNMPNGTTIQSSHTCNLLLTALPHQARQAHILPGLVHNSLISVGQLCDNECSVTFTQDQVTVSRNGKDVMYGSRDPKSRLWRVILKQKSILTSHNAIMHMTTIIKKI
jgi:hypothetical protein